MHTATPETLLEFLRNEEARRNRVAATAAAALAACQDREQAIHVPLELDGAIWSAEVERFDERGIDLIVDSQALGNREPSSPAAIRFLPEHGRMLRAPGQLTQGCPLARDRVRVSFALE